MKHTATKKQNKQYVVYYDNYEVRGTNNESDRNLWLEETHRNKNTDCRCFTVIDLVDF